MKQGRETKDIAASIRQRLLNRSAREGVDFQLMLTRYAIERMLYRLGQSEYRERFVLKGAMLFIAWEGWSPRPTRDVDLLGQGNPAASELKSIFEALCRLEVEPDGLIFHPETITVDDIREDQPYSGKRVRLRATLGEARIAVQADIGYGDVVFPALLTFPTLLKLPPPQILAYPPESVIAEKLEAMIRFGPVNSRMKDFYDLWQLALHFSFDGARLAEAIRATFQRRRTSLPGDLPLALTDDFYRERRRQTMWQAFLRKNRLAPAEGDFEVVGRLLQEFLSPPVQHLARRAPFQGQWPPGGPWKIDVRD